MSQVRKDKTGHVLRKGESQRKDGRYRFQYYDANHVRHDKYADTLQRLREIEKGLEKDLLDGLDTYIAGKVDINYIVDRYLEMKQNLKANSLQNYRKMYDIAVRDSFGKRIIGKVRFTDVKAFYITLMKDRNYTWSTVDNIHSVLHPAFTLAVRDRVLPMNPTDGVMSELNRDQGKNKGIRHALTVEEQKAFVSYVRASETYKKWDNLFTVLLGTGMRIGECAGICWQDVDLEANEIRVDHTLEYYKGENEDCYRYHYHTPKTEAGIRVIPMLGNVKAAIEDEYDHQKNTIGFCQQVIDGHSGFIFHNRAGNAINESTVNRALHRIVSDYNNEEALNSRRENREPLFLPRITCHIFRHTFCTRLCEATNNLKQIMYLMGHSDIKTTMEIYAEVTSRKTHETIEILDQNKYFF